MPATPRTGTDPLTPEKRSERMARVRARDTQLEIRFRRALWASGLRGWRCNVRSVYGTPDIAWMGRRVAVFVDSAWWHGHPSRWKPGRHGAWWDEKIARNRRRDEAVNTALRDQGWTVIRVWDFEIHKSRDECVARVRDALTNSRTNQSSRSLSMPSARSL